MEISSTVGQSFFFIIPIGFVIVCAALVFVFGFNSPVELPNFKHLRFSSTDKKAKGKKKSKDKKSQNGHATVIEDDYKPLKQSNKSDSKSRKSGESDKKKDAHKSPAKGGKKEDKKVEKKSGKENKEAPKNKKGAQKAEEKPKDFDDAGWETALSRKDKKNKRKVENGMASSPVAKKSPENKNKSNPVDKAQKESVQSGSNKGKSVNNNSNDSAKNKKKVRKD